ncbi:C6 zinc finger [Fusarium albosuccineum]|uniref:C6 zinc finger n=1 Tax=Fusarium albosuccineum TaxID=1237068 RepID=A0A8H4LD32_9HYPO|nr:C6 zinc finger [Fusarium albosuccineum]
MIEIGKGRVRLLDTLLAKGPVELKALGDLQAEIRNRVAEGTELAAYDDAIHLLRRSYTAVHHQLPGGLQNTDIFIWLFEVSHEFISLLRLRKPIAMALFACFSVLFRQLRSAWWVGNWSYWVLDQTYCALGAEEAYLWLVNGVKEVAESG